MAVKIGHASIDENGKAKNGKAGDQTGREVCIRDWYAKNWDAVLRPKKKAVAEASAKACEAGAYNSHFGYDQNQRNTGHTEAKKVGYDLSKVKVDCETDCSAYMTLCAIAGGVKKLEYTYNAPTTTTMISEFTKTGEYECLTDKKYTLSSDYLKRGDILVKAGSHTVMVLSNGSKVNLKDKVKDKIEDIASTVSTNKNTVYYPQYGGKSNSIVSALNELRFDGSFSHRKKIAKANSIINYTGTAAQNEKLLQLFKKGKLKRE